MELLAKFDGDNKVTLSKHSKDVCDLALMIYDHFKTGKKPQDKTRRIVELSALFHDIGKATKQFQQLLSKDKDESETNKKIPYLHNQVGSAYLYSHLNITDKVIKKSICNIVYWHHGVLSDSKPHKNLKYKDIYNNINSDDINAMDSVLFDLLGESYKTSEYEDTNTNVYSFLGSYDGINETSNERDLLFARSIVISADRLISEHINKSITEIFNLYLNSIFKSNDNIDFNIPESYDHNRFLIQKDIVSKTKKTTIVKAPAGFGKTNIGLMWAYKQKGKLLWVCPRNSVAESVYKSLLQELEVYNLQNKISIQLYLTGEVIDYNINDNEFEADIIVTNIDNYLKTTIDNGKLNQNLLINTCNVIFDEFHELIQDTALFYMFIITMNIRHILTNVNTLLLSATPNDISELWETINCEETTILPNKETHYGAAHNKEYTIVKNTMYDNNSLVIYNSISNTQDVYIEQDGIFKGDLMLTHSMFTKERKKELMDELYSKYGKKSNCDKGLVISAPILQAGLDISFKNLSESVCNPDNTGQRIGRCNRWGEYDDSCINFFKVEDSKSEELSISYDPKLLSLWEKELDKLKGSKITLEDFYKLYNSFYINNEKHIKEYNKSRLKKSFDLSCDIFPIKIFHKSKGNKEVYSINGNKLRSNGKNGLFYIVMDSDTGEWIGPFSDTNLYDDKYDVDKNLVLKTIANLVDDKRFSFKSLNSKHKNNIGSDTLKTWARMSDKPLVIFNKKYNNKLGVHKK